jgi:hypothetical protein
MWRKDSLFNKCCWINWISTSRKLKLDPCFPLCTSINLKWIKYLSKRPESLKLVQERAVNTLELIDTGNDLLNRTQMAQQLRKDWQSGSKMVIRGQKQPAWAL